MHSHLLFTRKRFLLVLELCDQVNLSEAPKPPEQRTPPRIMVFMGVNCNADAAQDATYTYGHHHRQSTPSHNTLAYRLGIRDTAHG